MRSAAGRYSGLAVPLSAARLRSMSKYTRPPAALHSVSRVHAPRGMAATMKLFASTAQHGSQGTQGQRKPPSAPAPAAARCCTRPSARRVARSTRAKHALKHSAASTKRVQGAQCSCRHAAGPSLATK